MEIQKIIESLDSMQPGDEIITPPLTKKEKYYIRNYIYRYSQIKSYSETNGGMKIIRIPDEVPRLVYEQFYMFIVEAPYNEWISIPEGLSRASLSVLLKKINNSGYDVKHKNGKIYKDKEKNLISLFRQAVLKGEKERAENLAKELKTMLDEMLENIKIPFKNKIY